MFRHDLGRGWKTTLSLGVHACMAIAIYNYLCHAFMLGCDMQSIYTAAEHSYYTALAHVQQRVGYISETIST